MKKIITLVILIFVSITSIFSDQIEKDAFWKFRKGDMIDSESNLLFNMDMAGPTGKFSITYDKDTDVKIMSLVILLSKDKTVENSDELFFDITSKTANNAIIKSIDISNTETTVNFNSSLDYIRREQGLLLITVQINGRTRTFFNTELVNLRMKKS